MLLRITASGFLDSSTSLVSEPAFADDLSDGPSNSSTKPLVKSPDSVSCGGGLSGEGMGWPQQTLGEQSKRNMLSITASKLPENLRIEVSHPKLGFVMVFYSDPTVVELAGQAILVDEPVR